ncbi:hypothetical protein Hypma_011911 [Hypsizygus marmoreus]|uniref:Uncharacterized protein n=1 Tax=Hypsizygus marmoreus TaxID=39966 RepID=A0A369JJY8_HYPMA|nr:hypothetical protein Hypma_011911 [Hypsizygus marmoreus]
MPRPRLYTHPEEKAAANREKSKRSYEQGTDSPGRGLRYREQSKKNTITFSNQELSAAKPPTLQFSQGNGLGYWSDRVERVAIKLKEAVGVNPGVYIEEGQHPRCRPQDLTISDPDLPIPGCDPAAGGPLCEEWKRSDVVRASVCDVVKSLEEILTYAMVDYDELILMYKSQKLMFQQ